MTESARFGWTVLLPVKVLAQAKSRLAALAGERRLELALALASDTVSAVVACPEVARVLVVTSDPVAEPGRRPAPAQRGAAARRGGGGAALARHRARGADRRSARTPPGRAGRRAARGLGRGRPGVRAGRGRRGHDDVRGRDRGAVPADVRRGVPGTTCRRRCHRARARRHRRTASGRGYAGRPAGGGCAWGRTADRRGRGGAPRRRVKTRAGARASAAAQILTTGQVRVLVIPSTL